jgi:hypothetical protein
MKSVNYVKEQPAIKDPWCARWYNYKPTSWILFPKELPPNVSHRIGDFLVRWQRAPGSGASWYNSWEIKHDQDPSWFTGSRNVNIRSYAREDEFIKACQKAKRAHESVYTKKKAAAKKIEDEKKAVVLGMTYKEFRAQERAANKAAKEKKAAIKDIELTKNKIELLKALVPLKNDIDSIVSKLMSDDKVNVGHNSRKLRKIHDCKYALETIIPKSQRR